MRLPDGTPAANVPINITFTVDKPLQIWQGSTDSDGAVYYTFNTIQAAEIKVKVSIHKFSKVLYKIHFGLFCFHLCFFQVSADGVHESKIIKRVSSRSNSFLYMSITNKVYSVKESLFVSFNTIQGPSQGDIYYMVRKTVLVIEYNTSLKKN